MQHPRQRATGRGAALHPANRFEQIHLEDDFEQLEDADVLAGEEQKIATQYFVDDSQSIVSQNSSPDIGFNFSINPYRGCVHGCSYCYARNTHEYLGLNAGLDFETKVMVKPRAAELFKAFLRKKSWRPQVIAFSGVTDCYQPAERKFELTRQCLQVAMDCRQPVTIVTKNALVVRDLDLLASMAGRNLVHVHLSINSLDQQLTRKMEPRTSVPAARLRAVEQLAAAGVPVGVVVAPVIAGLNDSEIPAILEQAAAVGAGAANYILLRLPLTVEPVFREWLQRTHPEKREMIEGRIRETRSGELSSGEFGKRMRGDGEIARQIGALFKVFAQKHRLPRKLPQLDFSQFQPPEENNGQMQLF